jgi:asparagine synthase (glutamine-hydrolysing)
MDAHWVRANAPAVIRALEEPPLALPALAQYRIFQLCREHGATVVLDGQGADEVLGGYPYHQRMLVADRLRRGRFGDAGRELRAIALRERVGRMRLLAAVALPSLRGRLRRRLPWVASPPRRDGEDVGRARADRGHDPSALNRQLYWDVRWGNVKIVLGYTDRNAMAHSVEARVPYFDRALVEFAFTLPDHFKVGDGQRKRILRDSARALLPPEVTDRPDRVGFAVPAGALMGDLLPDVRAAIRDGGILSSPWFHGPQALRMLDRFAAGDAARAPEVWRVYAFALWAREFDVALG